MQSAEKQKTKCGRIKCGVRNCKKRSANEKWSAEKQRLRRNMKSVERMGEYGITRTVNGGFYGGGQSTDAGYVSGYAAHQEI